MDAAALERECAVFTRHLVGAEPTPYVVRQYAAAHAVRPDTFAAPSGFGAFAVRLAHTSAFGARMADAHCRLFAPRGVLRRKLVLLLAILETTPPFHGDFDAVRGAPTAQVLALGVGAAAWLVALLLGTIVLLPARLVLGTGGSD
jgi:hypothetical protein